jgi:hypothetical protein
MLYQILWIVTILLFANILEAALFPAVPRHGGQAGEGREPAAERALPDFAHIHEELQRHK